MRPPHHYMRPPHHSTTLINVNQQLKGLLSVTVTELLVTEFRKKTMKEFEKRGWKWPPRKKSKNT